MSKKKSERQTQIREILIQEDKVRIIDLAKRLKVTPETIRSDLDELEQQNVVRREHGYASAVSSIVELPFNIRGKENIEEKRRVAYRAFQEIKDGQVIFLDSGSTVLAGLPVLANRKDLLIVTNSIPLAYQAGLMNLDVIFCGGRLMNVGMRTYGNEVTDMIDQVSFDLALLGTDGFNEKSDGFTALSYLEIAIKRHIMNRSEKIMMLTDSSKFEKKASFTFCKFHEIDMLVTNKITQEQLNIVKDVKKTIQA